MEAVSRTPTTQSTDADQILMCKLWIQALCTKSKDGSALWTDLITELGSEGFAS